MEAIVVIGLLVIAITQSIKNLVPQIKGLLTVVIAIVVGVVIAVLDTSIGVLDITIVEGIVAGLQAVGVTTVAGKIGGN